MVKKRACDSYGLIPNQSNFTDINNMESKGSPRKLKLSKQPSAPSSLWNGDEVKVGVNPNPSNSGVGVVNKDQQNGNGVSTYSLYGFYPKNDKSCAMPSSSSASDFSSPSSSSSVLKKTKSVGGKLEKLDSCNNNDDDNNSPAQMKRAASKMAFLDNLCMDPEQFQYQLKRLSKKNDKSDKATTPPPEKFLGISRKTPQARLCTLTNLLNSLTSPMPLPLGHSFVGKFMVTPTATPIDKEIEKLHKGIPKQLQHLKISVCGDKPEKLLNAKEQGVLAESMVKIGFISTLVKKLPLLGFEERKTVALIWCNLFRRPSTEIPITNYLEKNSMLLFFLLDCYHNQTLALITGRMIRECIRYEPLAKIILHSEYFYEIFAFLKTSTFEVSSDAFFTMQAILTEHKKLTADFLRDNFDRFFTHYDKLLTCDNYATQVSSLGFLGVILLDRRNYDVMHKYVQDESKLKSIILLMSENPSLNIQIEGFHIFKIFAINPTPTKKVRTILYRNKQKLIEMLSMIESDKHGEGFKDEKSFIIKHLKEFQNNLDDISPRSGSSSSASNSSSDA